MSKRVLVLMGGKSAEREVSLDSGRACAEALTEAGYQAEAYDFTGKVEDLVDRLKDRPDVVFNALHGRWGEDGCVQGLLELLGLPYTHSGVAASALAMDKPTAKKIVAGAGVISPHGVVLPVEELLRQEPLPRPYVVKPPQEGSSVGVRIVREGDNEPLLGANAWTFGDLVLVEEYIPGRELTVAVMGDRPLGVTEIVSKVGFYDYRAKYTEGFADHVFPAEISEALASQAMEAAHKAHQALGCRGVSRSDFRYDDTAGEPGRLFYLETNTQPGMTSMSLAPEQANHLGISFPELCGWMVEHATCGS